MDIVELWEKALKKTEIIRARMHPLLTFETIELPYIFLAESSLNIGDSVVRQGKVYIEKPSIVLPENLPHFEGFDFDEELHVSEDSVTNFLLVRGVKFPSYRYNNKTQSLEVYEGKLKGAIKHYQNKLQKAEEVHAGLIVGPEECWQFSVLIFICTMIAKSAGSDIKRLLDDFHKKRYLS
ncbi:MAG: hypothetical protein HQ572_05195 [Candidatus Omnitrophica bacterium]|nr:hypothetical protein [Candidatus Omnitrophota bacterium]